MNTLKEWTTDISIGLAILGFFGIIFYLPLAFS